MNQEAIELHIKEALRHLDLVKEQDKSRGLGSVYVAASQMELASVLLKQQLKPITENPDVQRLISQVVRLEAENDSLKAEKGMADMGFVSEGASKKIKQLKVENEKLKDILDKAKVFAKKHARAIEYFDELVEGGFTKMPSVAAHLVNQIGKELLQVLNSSPDPVQKAAKKCKETGSVEDLKAYNAARADNA